MKTRDGERMREGGRMDETVEWRGWDPVGKIDKTGNDIVIKRTREKRIGR